LREFVSVLEELDATQARGYLRRGDFSRWISDVFGDHALARELQGCERRYANEKYREVLDQVVAAISSRYELTDSSDVATVHEVGTVVT
jgi:hypothetical protein